MGLGFEDPTRIKKPRTTKDPGAGLRPQEGSRSTNPGNIQQLGREVPGRTQKPRPGKVPIAIQTEPEEQSERI
eukprot:5987524-Ditylum_brightwellii.AAC.1